MDILIVGAGLAGLTLAYWLEHAGGGEYRPVVIERSAHLRDDGFLLDFLDPGYAVAEKMNLLPALAAFQCPLERLVFLDKAGREQLSVPAAAFRVLADNRWISLMHGDLVRQLYEVVKARVPVQFETSITSLDQDESGVCLTMTDGTSRRFDLVVGADGFRSRVRQLLFGSEEQFSLFLGYYSTAFVAGKLSIRCDGVYTLAEPGRQVTIYPVDAERVATLLVHQTSRQIDMNDREGVERELEAVYGQMGWVVPELLERARQTNHIYFDTVSQIVLPRWSKGRVALVGDACQCVSLIVGQGASQAMGSAYRLARELAAVPDTRVVEALARYEQQIRPGIERVQLSGRRQGRWFVPDTRLRMSTRNLFLRMATWPAAAPILKRGLGLSGGFKL